MKIMGVYYRNDGDQTVPALLVWPDSSMIRSGKPVFLPSYPSGCSVVTALGIKIDRLGKTIERKYASRYYNEVMPVAIVLSGKSAGELADHKEVSSSDIVADYTVICGNELHKESLSADSTATLKYETLDSEPIETATMDLSGAEDKIASAIVFAGKRNTLKTGDIVVLLDCSHTVPAQTDSKISVVIDNNELLKFKLK